MKVFLISLLLILNFSCTKYASVSREAMNLEISPVNMDISHLNEIKWRVGKRREEVITQSITFIVDMPKIKEDDLEYLTKHRGVDSWIIRLIVNRGSETQDLGSLHALFKPTNTARNSKSGRATSNVSLKILYAAAFASERFRSFKCPAFGHNKRISDMSIEGEDEEFSLNISQGSPYNEKSHLVELSPSAFNGGHSLIGEYYLEIAPYESRRKMIHADFKRIPRYISVNREESIRVKSCDGVHPEIQ